MVAEVSANLSTETKSKCQHCCPRGAVRGFTPSTLSCVLAFLHPCTLTFTLDGDDTFRSGDSLDDSLDFYVQLRSYDIENLSKLLNPIVPPLENGHVTPFVQIRSYDERKRNVSFISSNSRSKIDEATTSLSLDYAYNCLCL